MSHAERQNLDAILHLRDKKNENALKALLERCAVTTKTVETGAESQEFLKNLMNVGHRRAIYIADHIDAEAMHLNRNIPLFLDNVLIVEQGNQNEIADQRELTAFNHILSNPTGGIPVNQLLITLHKIRIQDYFGLDKVMAAGSYIHRYTLSHSDQRPWFRDQLFQFVDGLSPCLRRSAGTFAQFAAEVQEELLMNAIWDANPKLRNQDRKQPVQLPPNETVTVSWCFDGQYLAVAVQDNFGTFEHEVVQTYLKFLFTGDKKTRIQLKRDAAGAGIGLCMVLERLSYLIINVSPGRLTEVISLIDLTQSPSAVAKNVRSLQYFSVCT